MNKLKRFLLTTTILLSVGKFCIAEDVVTGNILPNAGNSVSSLNSGSAPIISDDTSLNNLTQNEVLDGFTVTCDVAPGGICGKFWGGSSAKDLETAHDLQIKASGTLVGIEGTGQTSSDTITSTQAKLDQGVTLNSTIDMQNCEWSGSSWACGGAVGAADPYTTTVKILNSDGTVLSTVTQERTTDAGYNANSRTFTDEVIYTGTGSNKYEWYWKGEDGAGSTANNYNIRGPNLLGAKLTMKFNSEDLVVLDEETTTTIEEVSTNVTTAVENSGINTEEITIEAVEINTETKEVVVTVKTEEIALEATTTEAKIEEQENLEEAIEIASTEELVTMSTENPNVEEEVIETETPTFEEEEFVMEEEVYEEETPTFEEETSTFEEEEIVEQEEEVFEEEEVVNTEPEPSTEPETEVTEEETSTYEEETTEPETEPNTETETEETETTSTETEETETAANEETETETETASNEEEQEETETASTEEEQEEETETASTEEEQEEETETASNEEEQEEETTSSEEESEETEVAEEEESEETEVAEGEESADTDVKVAKLEDKESVEKEVEKSAKQIETDFFKDQPQLTAAYKTVLVDSREIYSEVPKNFFTQASLDTYTISAYDDNNLNDYSQQNNKLVEMESNIIN